MKRVPSFCLAALVLTVSLPLAAFGDEPSKVAPFQPAFIVEGNAHARGVAYGKHFREGIHEFLNLEIYKPFLGKPASKEEMLAYAKDCGPVIREVCPKIAEELEGVAEGAGLSFDEIVLINLHEEIYHRSPLPKHGHCTAVAISPADSGDKHTYVGQTWDWMVTLAGKSSVVEWRRDDGPSVLAYTYPGLPMGAGMNSAGIAFTWTSAALSRKGQSARVGLPTYALIAHLLNQKTLDDVVREAKRDKHAGWFTFVFADSEGNIASIEGSPKGVVVERPKDRLARVDYGSAEMLGMKDGKPGTPHARCTQMNDLLKQSAGKNDKETLIRYFTNPEYKILGDSPKNKSIDVMIYDTTTRTAYLTRGPHYGIAWREYQFGAAK